MGHFSLFSFQSNYDLLSILFREIGQGKGKRDFISGSGYENIFHKRITSRLFDLTCTERHFHRYLIISKWLSKSQRNIILLALARIIENNYSFGGLRFSSIKQYIAVIKKNTTLLSHPSSAKHVLEECEAIRRTWGGKIISSGAGFSENTSCKTIYRRKLSIPRKKSLFNVECWRRLNVTLCSALNFAYIFHRTFRK